MRLARSRWIHASIGAWAAAGLSATMSNRGVGVRILDRRPAVGGGLGFVDDQVAGGATPGSLLFVGPAAVIGLALPPKSPSPPSTRSLTNSTMSLPRTSTSLEIVPVAPGRGHAIADEDQGHVVERHLLHAVQWRLDRDLLALVRLSGWPNELEAQSPCSGDVGLEQRDVLSPLALTAGQVSAGLDLRPP